jgi:hypothetical protein
LAWMRGLSKAAPAADVVMVYSVVRSAPLCR